MNITSRATGLILLLWPAVLSAAAPLPKMELKLAYPNLVVQRPLVLNEVPDGTKRMFLVEQRGIVLILPQDREATNTTVFLDISDRKPYVDNEEGLLGFAFHPQFKSNGKFYVNYTLHNPRRSVVSEFQVSKDDPNRMDVQSERILFELSQPYGNHKGG